MPQSRIMSLMHALRNTPWLTRLVLLCFALALGVTVASPMVNPQDELVICTSAGMAKLNTDNSPGSEPGHDVQCPLCVVGGAAPPAIASVAPESFQAVADVPPGIAIIRVAAATAAPPPSRGPPSSV